MKMYILILDDVPVGHALNSAAHAALACYLTYGHRAAMKEWVNSSFKKVTCKVTREQLAQAQKLEKDFITIKESKLHNRIMGSAFMPRETWNPFFKTLNLWT